MSLISYCLINSIQWSNLVIDMYLRSFRRLDPSLNAVSVRFDLALFEVLPKSIPVFQSIMGTSLAVTDIPKSRKLLHVICSAHLPE